MNRPISVSEAIDMFKQNLTLLTGDIDPVESIVLTDRAMSKLRDEIALQTKYISRKTFDFARELSIADVMIYETEEPKEGQP